MNDQPAPRHRTDPLPGSQRRQTKGRMPWLRARARVVAALSTRPSVYLPLARLKYRSPDGPRPVIDATEIVLEGYPRSANTFAVEAFKMVQGRLLSIS